MIQVFSKEWFELRQKYILWFANSWVGRRFFHIQRDVPKGKKLTKMLPHCVEWANDDGTMTIDFRTHPKFAKRLYHGLKPLWFMLHGWDFAFGQKAQQLNFGFDTLTVYPDADPETSTVDGIVGRESVDEIFATIQGGAGNFFNDTSTTVGLFLRASTTIDQYDRLRRAILLFDTSTIPDAGVISAAVLSLDAQSRSNGLGTSDMHLVSSNPASNTALADSDYANTGTTSFGSIAYAGFAPTGYKDITLNASGIAAISLVGITKFGLRIAWDKDNSFTGVWSSAASNSYVYSNADETGTSVDPRLVVTYTPPIVPLHTEQPVLVFRSKLRHSLFAVNIVDPTALMSIERVQLDKFIGSYPDIIFSKKKLYQAYYPSLSFKQPGFHFDSCPLPTSWSNGDVAQTSWSSGSPSPTAWAKCGGLFEEDI